jgi:predicted dehydrogenase
MEKLSIGIIGAGYWGPNLVRNFSQCPRTKVVAVCDSDRRRLDAIGRTYSDVKLVESVDQLLELGLDAVAIATPVSTHYSIVMRCLEAGVHVLVEKPLAKTVAEAKAMVDLAARKQRVLMVDHTYLFSRPIRLIKKILDEGELGDVLYVDSVRINLGLFQRDVNVLWDLAPHDLSILQYLLATEPRSVSAWGCAHTELEHEDVAYINIDYGDKMLATIHLSWLSPVKVRQMIIAGSRKSLIFNELNTAEPIKVYDRGFQLDRGGPPSENRQLLVSYRSGDIWSPNVEPGEALQGVVSHFAECITEGTQPISDGQLGLRVVKALEAATRSVRAQGGRVILTNGIENYGRIDHTAASAVGPIAGGELSPNRAGRAVG